MAKQYKLQVELSQSQLESLEILQEEGDLRTKKELLDTAFTLLKWAVAKKKEGSSIISIDPKGAMKELEMPYLENVKAKARRAAELEPAVAAAESREVTV